MRTALLILTIVSGCSSSEKKKEVTFATTVLSGKIGNKSWTFVSGRATPSLSDPAKSSVTLIAESNESPCSAFILKSSDSVSVLFSTKNEVGQFTFDNHTNATLYDGTTNQISFEGGIAIDEITTSKIKGRLNANVDSENNVNGTFEIPRCCKKADNQFEYEVCK